MDSKFSVNNLINALNKREDEVIHGALAAWLNCPLPTLKSTASELMQNEELAAALEKNLTAPKGGLKEDVVCKWFYHWYQIDAQETRRFVLRYIPQLIWVYLYNIFNNEAPPGVEACLLCIYNQEVVERNDMEIIFHPPTLSLPSYLHKTNSDTNPLGALPAPNSSAMLAAPAFTAPGLGPNPNVASAGPNSLGQSSSLTENALRQFNKQVNSVTVEKALKPINLATNSNRGAIIRVALQKYNSNISLFSPRSWIAYCKMSKRLASFGFDFTITPIPLLKSKSFSKKYEEDDMDNMAIDSDEEFMTDDDFGDELSDSDNENRVRDVEKGDQTIAATKSPGTPNTPRRKVQRHLRESSTSSNSSASSSKIPPLSLPGPSNSSSNPATPTSSSRTPKNNEKTEGTPTTNNLNNSNDVKNSMEMQNTEGTPKAPIKPPVRIILAAPCWQEMVTGLTFCIFKDSYKEHALKALRKIHLRACYDLMPEIILSANALLHLEFDERTKITAQPGKTTPRNNTDTNNIINNNNNNKVV